MVYWGLEEAKMKGEHEGLVDLTYCIGSCAVVSGILLQRE